MFPSTESERVMEVQKEGEKESHQGKHPGGSVFSGKVSRYVIPGHLIFNKSMEGYHEI